MRARHATVVLGVLGFCAALGFGCSADHGGLKPEPTREPPDAGDGRDIVCASDAECPAVLPKCWSSGTCVEPRYCDVDADCADPALPFCDGAHQCMVCLTNAQCPAEEPVCTSMWGGGIGCAECRGGDSSTCERGKWCTSVQQGRGGTCLAPDCPTSLTTPACSACASENAPDCLNADVCIDELGALADCYTAQDPAWTPELCPIGGVPAMSGCTPPGCTDQAAAFDTCILGCGVVRQRCFAIFTGD